MQPMLTALLAFGPGAGHVAAGRWFIWMNFLAHSFMYTYYTITASGRKLPKYVSMCVTTVQTTQMLVGVYISIMVYLIKKSNHPCHQSFANLYLSFFLYATFAFLFIRFFVNAYIRKPKRKDIKEH
uniref:Elongation of very long chain fatty acids protein n=1 Tax=Plectus sambesii TaxID=2011161 RepID=A0A914X6P4_9BILA